MKNLRTQRFFDQMSRTYDRDIREIGWDPVRVVRDWPFVVMPRQTVIDAGCGTGLILEHFAGADRTLIGFDLSEEMIEQANRRSALRETELFAHSVDEDWPIQDNTADRIVCLAVLEFVERLELVFDEIARCLRPGGRALISTEEIKDAEGVSREAREERYGELTIWRREVEEVDMALPPELAIVRHERVDAYEVDERGFTAAYRCFELELQS